MNEGRIAYYDILRGIAIIGVIAIHSTGVGYTLNNTSFDFNATIFWRQIINFSVPLFLTLSGYFSANQKVDTIYDYLLFVKKQIPRVFVPYFLWSLLYSGLSLVHRMSFNEILFNLFTFQAIGPFYFILLIIQYYFLLPLLKKMATTKGLILSTIISLFCCLIIFYFRYYTKSPLPSIVYGGLFPTWIIFFVLGIYIKGNIIKISKKVIVILLILCFLLSLFETYLLYMRFNNIIDAVTAVKMSSFIYSVFVILLVFRNVDSNKKNRILAYIGEVSFGIYLSHIFFLGIISSVLNRLLPELDSYGLLKQLVLVVLTLVSCLIFACIVRKINKKIAIKYLGQ